MKRGDIVLLAFPFSNGVGVKMRPALVVQADRNNRRLTNTIVAMITTSVRAASEPTQMNIALDSDSGHASGLLHDSAVKCENLFTIEQALIQKVIGHLPKAAMRQVDRCLRSALGLA